MTSDASSLTELRDEFVAWLRETSKLCSGRAGYQPTKRDANNLLHEAGALNSYAEFWESVEFTAVDMADNGYKDLTREEVAWLERLLIHELRWDSEQPTAASILSKLGLIIE